jgi:hypothetical protein
MLGVMSEIFEQGGRPGRIGIARRFRQASARPPARAKRAG